MLREKPGRDRSLSLRHCASQKLTEDGHVRGVERPHPVGGSPGPGEPARLEMAQRDFKPAP
jgi:hypothetical protein